MPTFIFCFTDAQSSCALLINISLKGTAGERQVRTFVFFSFKISLFLLPQKQPESASLLIG